MKKKANKKKEKEKIIRKKLFFFLFKFNLPEKNDILLVFLFQNIGGGFPERHKGGRRD